MRRFSSSKGAETKLDWPRRKLPFGRRIAFEPADHPRSPLPFRTKSVGAADLPKNASTPTPRIALAGIDPHGPVQAYFDRFAVEQAERKRRNNDKTNERKRQREFAAIKARIPG